MKKFYAGASFIIRYGDEYCGYDYSSWQEYDMIVCAKDRKSAFRKIWKWGQKKGAVRRNVFLHQDSLQWKNDKGAHGRIIRIK